MDTDRAATGQDRTSPKADVPDGADALLVLAEQVLKTAKRHKLRIASAESCTGGLLSSLLTDVEGYSGLFERGFATYSEEAKAAYAWLTLGFFAVSLGLHWYFGWRSYVGDALEHGLPPETAEYLNQMLRDTFENWQSEFLQLLWQVVGLAYFLYVGSPSSKENDDRLEEKIDLLLLLQGGSEVQGKIDAIDRRFLRHGGGAKSHK